MLVIQGTRGSGRSTLLAHYARSIGAYLVVPTRLGANALFNSLRTSMDEEDIPIIISYSVMKEFLKEEGLNCPLPDKFVIDNYDLIPQEDRIDDPRIVGYSVELPLCKYENESEKTDE